MNWYRTKEPLKETQVEQKKKWNEQLLGCVDALHLVSKEHK